MTKLSLSDVSRDVQSFKVKLSCIQRGKRTSSQSDDLAMSMVMLGYGSNETRKNSSTQETYIPGRFLLCH